MISVKSGNEVVISNILFFFTHTRVDNSHFYEDFSDGLKPPNELNMTCLTVKTICIMNYLC